jgi:hypothetical protein
MSRRRWGLVLLVLGAAAAAGPLVTARAEERAFVFRIADPGRVERVEMVWTDAGGEPLRHTTLSFEIGRAPREIERSIALAAGRYGVAATLWRNGLPKTTERVVDVVDDAAAIVIPIP